MLTTKLRGHVLISLSLWALAFTSACGGTQAPPPRGDGAATTTTSNGSYEEASESHGGRADAPPAEGAALEAAPESEPSPADFGGGYAEDSAGGGVIASPGPSGRAKKDSAVRGKAKRYPAAPPPELSAPRAEAPGRSYSPRPVAAPALKAGRHDDNKQYNRFLQFMEENRSLIPYPLNVSERLVVQTVDKHHASLPNCQVQVKTLAGKTLATTTTFADGRTHFFPQAHPGSEQDYTVAVTCDGTTRNGQLSRQGRRENLVKFPIERRVPQRVPVDIAIVIDTTGSMGSQIDRLKTTLQAIHFQLTQLSTKPDLRFGLVAYRDRGDAYVTQVRNFTNDVQAFQQTVNALEADGGGDTPEDLQSALEKAMHELAWRTDALRLGFVVADAVPHTDYGQEYNYLVAAQEALGRGIKWTMVGAGGLPRAGEVIFRQIAQLTMGEYVFVTQSAAGDRDGGVGEASHHVGTNYQTENLDQAIVRIVRRELSYLTEEPKDFDYTVTASGTAQTPKEDVLGPAVKEILRQLHDYSSLRIKEGTPLAVVPVACDTQGYGDVTGYLSEELVLAASRNPAFKVVERDLQAVADELKVQLSELFDQTEAVPIGNMIGAELLVAAKLTVRGDEATLFAKLVRVETGEILAVARATISGGVVRKST